MPPSACPLPVFFGLVSDTTVEMQDRGPVRVVWGSANIHFAREDFFRIGTAFLDRLTVTFLAGTAFFGLDATVFFASPASGRSFISAARHRDQHATLR